LSNDRVAKPLAQRGDRAEAGQVIAIMDSRSSTKCLTEAQAQAKVSQAELAKVKAQNLRDCGSAKPKLSRPPEQLKRAKNATKKSHTVRCADAYKVTAANTDYTAICRFYKEGAMFRARLKAACLENSTGTA